MSHLRCLCEIFPWSCHKMAYSEVTVTVLCHNDRIALIDVVAKIVAVNQQESSQTKAEDRDSGQIMRQRNQKDQDNHKRLPHRLRHLVTW